MNSTETAMLTADVPAATAVQLDRARQFLREIRDGIEQHALAARNSRVILQERRLDATSTVRLSGVLDGVLVDLQIDIVDDTPLRPRVQYSTSLDRLRSAPVMGPATTAFTVAHDRAWASHYPDALNEQQAADLAIEKYRASSGSGAGVH